MVTFPPYLASSFWYGAWLDAISEGRSLETAVKIANSGVTDPRIFGRTLLLSNDGQPLVISMAVEGGSRQLRSFQNVEGLTLSDHGNWRKNHLGAIEAAFGRFPYFSFIFEHLYQAYNNRSLVTLNDFNTELHRHITTVLTGTLNSGDFNLFKQKQVLLERGKEIAESINPAESVINILMQYGPEAITGVFALYYNGGIPI